MAKSLRKVSNHRDDKQTRVVSVDDALVSWRWV